LEQRPYFRNIRKEKKVSHAEFGVELSALDFNFCIVLTCLFLSGHPIAILVSVIVGLLCKFCRSLLGDIFV